MLPDRKRCFILDSCSSEAIQRSVGDIPRLERERERERESGESTGHFSTLGGMPKAK